MKSLNLRRVGAYVIDIFIVSMIASFIAMIPLLNPERNSYNKKYDELLELYDHYDKKEISDSDYQAEYIKISYDLNRLNMNYVIIDLVLIIGYFGVFQWQMKGQTLGKRLLKVKVVSNSEKPLNFVNYLLRTVILNNIIITIAQLAVIFSLPVDRYFNIYSNVNLVGYILLYIIVFMVLVRQDSRGLHDLIANTKVILLTEDSVEIEEKVIKKEKKNEVVEDASFEEVKSKKTKSTKPKK